MVKTRHKSIKLSVVHYLLSFAPGQYKFCEMVSLKSEKLKKCPVFVPTPTLKLFLEPDHVP